MSPRPDNQKVFYLSDHHNWTRIGPGQVHQLRMNLSTSAYKLLKCAPFLKLIVNYIINNIFFTKRGANMCPPKRSMIPILLKFMGSSLRIDPVLGHKTSLTNLRSWNHNAIFPIITVWNEISSKKTVVKITNMWRPNNILLNNHWVNEEIKEQI